MKFEWRAPLVSNEGWKLMEATTLTEVANELAPRSEFYDVQCRNAETKESVNWRNYARYNGGRMCDTLDGPCSCGAWH